MDLFDVARACARRWYIFLPLIGVTLVFSYRAYSNVQPVYFSSATIGLASPSVMQAVQAGPEVRTNALVNNGGMTLISNLLALGMSNASAHEQVAAQGGLTDYTATVFAVPGGQLPLVVLAASSPDPEAVTSTLQLAAVQAETTLRDLQQSAGVPEDQMIHTYPVGAAGAPVPALPSRTRSTVSLFVVGFGFAVLVTVLADVWLVRRQERRGINTPDSAVELGPTGSGSDTEGSETPRSRPSNKDHATPDRVPDRR